MLGLFGNLSMIEIVVFGVIAILVFGKNLPDVASDAARKLGRLRRSLEDLRRESGIDREVNEVRRSLQQGLNRPVRAREVAGAVAKRALDEAGLGEEERRAVTDADPRKVFGALAEDPSQAARTTPARPEGPEGTADDARPRPAEDRVSEAPEPGAADGDR